MASTILEQILENVQAGARIPTDGDVAANRGTASALERSVYRQIERSFERLMDDAARIARRSTRMFEDPDVRRRVEAEWNRIIEEEVGGVTAEATTTKTLSLIHDEDHFESPTPSVLDAVEAEIAYLESEDSDTVIEAPAAIDSTTIESTTIASQVVTPEAPAPTVSPDATMPAPESIETDLEDRVPEIPVGRALIDENSIEFIPSSELEDLEEMETPAGSEVVEEVRDLLRSMQPQNDTGDEILQRLQTLTREVRDLAKREVVVTATPERGSERAAPPPPPQKRVEIGDIEGMIDGLLGM